jgi:uncharacterized protein YndB with AHSA1/START domain
LRIPDLTITRVFEAPRELVFKAWTDSAHGNDWSAPRGFTVAAFEADLRPGGAWRLRMRTPEGKELGVGGVYREIVPPERLVATEVFDDAWYPGEAVDTMVMDEQDGKTTLTVTVLYESQEARDAVLQSDMARGAAESYDKLAELLATDA